MRAFAKAVASVDLFGCSAVQKWMLILHAEDVI